MLKSELRQLFLEKRQTLNDNQFKELNENLCTQVMLFMKDLAANLTIASFLPIPSKQEINTALIHDQLRHFPFLHTLCFPRVESKNKMCFYKIDSSDDIEISKWGIPEPKANPEKLVKSQDLQIMFIPLLVFNQQGHRVGYGKGFYDQYLAQCNPDLIKIGLSLFDEPSEIDDVEETDVALNIVITPSSVQFC